MWAWKKHRIKLVQKYVDRMLVIFPFEEAVLPRARRRRRSLSAIRWRSCPLPAISREQFAAGNGLDPAKTWIGLLPGSRPKEIRDNLPEMLEAARSRCGQASTGRGVLRSSLHSPCADSERRAARRGASWWKTRRRTDVRLVDDARATLFHARASVVASGTATVEAALMGNPFVVVYRVSSLTYAIAKRVVKVPHVAMVNLIAGKRLCRN